MDPAGVFRAREPSFLERQVVEIQGVRILGTSLWSYIPPQSVARAEQTMNDYQISFINDDQRGMAVPMTAAFTNDWYQQSLQWLEQQIEKAKREDHPVVVLTHHTPTLQGTSNPKYDGDPLSHCFSSDPKHLLCDPVKVWACGHTHWNFDTLLEGGTRLVSNQRGYPGQESMGYDSQGIVLRIKPPGSKTSCNKQN